MNEPPPLNTLLSLLPFLVICSALAVLIGVIARRKGRSPIVALLGFVPFVNGLYALWLCSLTDAAVLDAIDEIRRSQYVAEANDVSGHR